MYSVTNKKVMFSIGALLSLLLLIPTTQAAWQPDPAFGLGEAGKFAVLSLGKPTAETLGQSKLDLSAVTIYGDVGVGPYGTLDFQGPSVINGDLFLDTTLQNILTDAGTVNGERFEDADLSTAVASAIAAAKANASLPITKAFGRIITTTAIYGNGGLNVIAIEGIDFKKSSVVNPLVLTLHGGSEDLFVLNVSGKFVLGPNSRIEGNGIDPSRVLINIGKGNTPVQFAANSYVGGTLLSPDRKMGPLQGASGPVIGAYMQEISLVGGAILNPPLDTPYPIAVITADSQVNVGDLVQLDGSASSEPSGEDLIYSWSLEGPDTSAASLSDASSVEPFFTADLVGDYYVQLIVVSEGTFESDLTTKTISAVEPGELVDLSLSITDYPDSVVKKETITYTLIVQNKGGINATGVYLDGSLIGAVRGTPTVTSSDPSDMCSYDALAFSFTCQMGDMYVGEVTDIEVQVVTKKAGSFGLNAEVSSDAGDLTPEDNFGAAQTLVTNE